MLEWWSQNSLANRVVLMDQNVPKGAFTNKVSNLIFQIAMWCGFGQFSQRVEINRVNAKYLQLIALAPKTSESKCSKATNVVVSWQEQAPVGFIQFDSVVQTQVAKK